MNAKLVACPDCGGEVSPRAVACPKCGAPVSAKPPRTNRAGARWEGAGFLLILAGIVGYLSGSPTWLFAGLLLGMVGFAVFIVGRFK